MKKIDTIEQAEVYILNLKRDGNWLSNDELLQNLQQAHQLAIQHNREDLYAPVGVAFGFYYLDNATYSKAWEYLELARNAAEKYNNSQKLLEAISLQYSIQLFLGNLEGAQQLVNEQMDTAYKFNDNVFIANSYNNQANLYHRQNMKDPSIEAFEKGIPYLLKTKNPYYISLYLIGYSTILLDFNEPEKAEPYLQKGFQIAKRDNLKKTLASGYVGFAELYKRKNEKNKSIRAYKKGIDLYHQLNSINFEVMNKIALAGVYRDFNDNKAAIELLKQTIPISEAHDLKYNLIYIYEILSDISEKNQDYAQALYYHKKLLKVKDEFLNTESDKRIRNLETQQKVNILTIEKKNAVQMANIKHDFLANMSHEIRTPINSILGICYLLEQRKLDVVEMDYISRLKRSGENLLGIINDVLDISKIESGKMELVHESFRPERVLMDVHQALEPKAQEKNMSFRTTVLFDASLTLKGDAVRLYQVLLNFTSNAIKFTHKGSVTLESSAQQAGDNNQTLTFIIRDTGIGIAKDKLDKIFERYEQADANIKNTFGGTGLGLSISRKIVEMMNGSIDVKSRLNKGTQFTIVIPFLKSAEESAVIPELPLQEVLMHKLQDKIILIADDHEENRLVAKETLLNVHPSLHILEAQNGQEVLTLLDKHAVDVILMDMDMPVLNGVETVQSIRCNNKHSKIRIIGNTASLMTLDKDEIHALGFDDFILKPYSPEWLIERVCSQL